MFDFQVRIDQDDVRKIRKAFQYLDEKSQKKFIRKAIRAKLKSHLLPQLKSAAPVKTGQLKKNLKIRAIKRTRTAVGLRVVSEFKTKEGSEYNVFYGSFLEYGWKHGKRGTPNRKRIRTHKGWMRRVAKRQEAKVIRLTVTEIARLIENEWGKA